MLNDPRNGEVYDETLSALYEATRDVEPPAWLDQHILTAAQAAVALPPKPAASRSQRRSVRSWALPVALAATVIMAVGIVRLVRETGEWQPRMDMPVKARSVAEPAAEADIDIPMNTRSMAEPAAEVDAVSSDPPVLQPTGQRPSAAPPAPIAEPALRMMQRATPSPAAPAMREQELLMSEERRKQDMDGPRIRPVLRDEEAKIQRQRADRSPEEWLADIAELRRQGRITEAAASLAEFQSRYPDYPQPILEGTD